MRHKLYMGKATGAPCWELKVQCNVTRESWQLPENDSITW